ncbi:hypothetical protein [Marinobacter sp. VGCF2001]|uniref:hypothetical protein n=1 Tax=Marinobacter sp. VGCF2001 TaxID=3417189 RepID=UPI003CEEE10A
MKRFGKTTLALLLCLSASACASSKLNVHDSVEPQTETAGVVISRTAHPIKLPLKSLAGATFIGSDGELILYNKLKGLFATVVTSDDWSNPNIRMNQAPGYIFNRDLSAVQTPEFRRELEGIIAMTLEPTTEKETSVVTVGEITAYIAFNPKKTIIMLTSPDKPELFTQLVLDNFSWEEIEHEILKGIGG